MRKAVLGTLKNWGFAIIGFALVILDQGFDVLNPLLVELGLSDKWIGVLKLFFGLYGVYKLKLSLPTQNSNKLEALIKGKNKNVHVFAEEDELIGTRPSKKTPNE